MAPLLPMVELMKYCAKPWVWAWVQIKMATPKTTPTRLSRSARLRCVAKRNAMYNGAVTIFSNFRRAVVAPVDRASIGPDLQPQRDRRLILHSALQQNRACENRLRSYAAARRRVLRPMLDRQAVRE